jgi:hypothetical protein
MSAPPVRKSIRNILKKDENYAGRRGSTLGRAFSKVLSLGAEKPQDDVGKKAYLELLSTVREVPNLELITDTIADSKWMITDKEIIDALNSADDPRLILRKGGMDTVGSARCERLLPLAIKYREALTSYHVQKAAACTPRRKVAIFLVLVAIALLCIGLFLQVYEKHGWGAALCTIKAFSNATVAVPCTGNCVFDVQIRSDDALLTINWWEPERVVDPETNRVSFVGDGMQCCNDVLQQEDMDCCLFLELKTMLFCDDWPHRDDSDGKACPTGNWACLYKLEPGSERDVQELIADFDQEMMRNFYIASAVFFGLAFVIAITNFICQKLWACYEACFRCCLRRLNMKALPDPALIRSMSTLTKTSSISLPKALSPSKRVTKVTPADAASESGGERGSVTDWVGKELSIAYEQPLAEMPTGKYDQDDLDAALKLAEEAKSYNEASATQSRGLSAPPTMQPRGSEKSTSSRRTKKSSQMEKTESSSSMGEADPRGRKTLFHAWQDDEFEGEYGGTVAQLAQRAQSEWTAAPVLNRPIMTPFVEQQMRRGMMSPRQTRNPQRGQAPNHRTGQARTKDMGATWSSWDSGHSRGRVPKDNPQDWGWASQDARPGSSYVRQEHGFSPIASKAALDATSTQGSWRNTQSSFSPSRSPSRSPTKKSALRGNQRGRAPGVDMGTVRSTEAMMRSTF